MDLYCPDHEDNYESECHECASVMRWLREEHVYQEVQANQSADAKEMEGLALEL